MTRFLIAALLLTSLAAGVLAQQPRVTVAPNPARVGERLTITFHNGTTSTLMLPNTAPWNVHNAVGQRIYAAPFTAGTILLAPGKSLLWNWDQKDSFSNQVPKGDYEIRLYFAFFPHIPSVIAATRFNIGDAGTISVAGTPRPGESVSFLLHSPTFTRRGYQVALSLGKSPGIPIGAGRVLPLNPDPLFFGSIFGGPPVIGNFAGLLDGNGRATAKLWIPNVTQLKGLRFFAAYAVLHLAAPNGIVEISQAGLLVVQ